MAEEYLIPRLSFTKDWRNRDHFPTYEANEEQIRNDMQYLYEEIKDYLNDKVAGTLCQVLQKQLAKVYVSGVKFLEATIEGDDITLMLEVTTSDGNVTTSECQLKDLAAALGTGSTGGSGGEGSGEPGAPGVGIQSIEYDPVNREWVFTYTNGEVDRIEMPASELGGFAWVSLDTPGEDHKPETGYAVGQQWLRPGFCAENHALKAWSVSNGTVANGTHSWDFTADDATGTIAARQTLTSVGKPNDRVFVLLLAENIAAHQSALTLTLNGEEHDLKQGGGVFEAHLDSGGAFEIAVHGSWTYSAAPAKVTLKHLTVVNADAVERAAEGSKPMSDWSGFLESYAPFEQVLMPRTVFIQEAPGKWDPISYDVLPVDRGGTGKTAFTSGLLLYGGPSGELVQLSAPASEDCLLSFAGGKPQWLTKDQSAQRLGAMRFKIGTYTGTGADREIDLGCEAQLLFVREVKEEITSGNASSKEEHLQLFAGEAQYKVSSITYEFNGNEREAHCYNHLKLDGRLLKSWSTYQSASHTEDNYRFNHLGKNYQWVAVY